MPDARYGANAPITFRMGGMQVEALYYGADLIWPAGHIISIPADEINWTDYAPLILSGVHVRVPVDVMSWQDFEPGIELDGIAVPVDRLDWTDYAPSVFSGAHVHVPLDAMQWADFAPVVGTNAVVDMPLDALAWVDYAPTVSAGASVSLPFDAMGWTDFTPLVSAGASVSLPVDAWKWGDYNPNLGYAFSKAFSSAFNAIPHDYGVVAPVDEIGWADYVPDIEAATDVEFDFIADYVDATTIDVGDAAAGRHIYVTYNALSITSNMTLSGGSIGGVPITIMEQMSREVATDVYLFSALARVSLPDGITAAQSLTWASGNPQAVITCVYRVKNLMSLDPVDIASSNLSLTSSWSRNLTVSAGGFCLAAMYTSGQSSRTFPSSSQMTRDATVGDNSNQKSVTFSSIEASTHASKSFSFSSSGANSGPFILASFR